MTNESEGTVVPPADRAAAAPADWQDDGLLWLINASVFHPRGYSLGIPKVEAPLLADALRNYAELADFPALVEYADGLAESLARWLPTPVLQGDGVEVWQYATDDPPTPDDLLARVEALFARARRPT